MMNTKHKLQKFHVNDFKSIYLIFYLQKFTKNVIKSTIKLNQLFFASKNSKKT